jgi:hypothetical protein
MVGPYVFDIVWDRAILFKKTLSESNNLIEWIVIMSPSYNEYYDASFLETCMPYLTNHKK